MGIAEPAVRFGVIYPSEGRGEGVLLCGPPPGWHRVRRRIAKPGYAADQRKDEGWGAEQRDEREAG